MTDGRLAKQVGGRALSYLSVQRGRPPAFYESGHSTTRRYADSRRPCIFKSTEYFRYTRQRADRAGIRDEWIELAIQQPLAEVVQGDGRTRRWVYIPEEHRYLRVILLADGETVHNAFFDRRFRP